METRVIIIPFVFFYFVFSKSIQPTAVFVLKNWQMKMAMTL